ncbi:hypothetical protein [Nonomuraea sp. NPDC049480]|uniref:hypothetical protein n=1 Tax=Nonomuraea sp. NPDC049480 TaxID=3364353 RepID=UPI0037978889
MRDYAARMWDTRRDPATGLFRYMNPASIDMIQHAAMVQIFAVPARTAAARSPRPDGTTVGVENGDLPWHPAETGVDTDYTAPFSGGPLDLGFDRFFSLAGSLDMQYAAAPGEQSSAPARAASQSPKDMASRPSHGRRSRPRAHEDPNSESVDGSSPLAARRHHCTFWFSVIC